MKVASFSLFPAKFMEVAFSSQIYVKFFSPAYNGLYVGSEYSRDIAYVFDTVNYERFASLGGQEFDQGASRNVYERRYSVS